MLGASTKSQYYEFVLLDRKLRVAERNSVDLDLDCMLTWIVLPCRHWLEAVLLGNVYGFPRSDTCSWFTQIWVIGRRVQSIWQRADLRSGIGQGRMQTTTEVRQFLDGGQQADLVENVQAQIMSHPTSTRTVTNFKTTSISGGRNGT